MRLTKVTDRSRTMKERLKAMSPEERKARTARATEARRRKWATMERTGDGGWSLEGERLRAGDQLKVRLDGDRELAVSFNHDPATDGPTFRVYAWSADEDAPCIHLRVRPDELTKIQLQRG